MLYRQYGANTARIVPPFRPHEILDATRRVMRHYALVLPLLQEDADRRAAALRDASREIAAFDQAMRASPARLDTYTQSLNALPARYVWWWAVANPLLRHLWNN